MSNVLSKIAVFVAGAGVGSVVTYMFVKNRYEQIIREEIASVEKTFSVLNNKSEEFDDSEVPDEYYANADEYKQTTEYEKNKASYMSIIQEAGYNKVKEGSKMEKIRVIPPTEFGECGYEEVSLLYHTDGVISEEFGDIVENADELIGDDFMNHFGEYEEDSVYIRNYELETDYAILKDYRAYSENS